MKRLIFVVMICAGLTGCTKGPSDKVAMNLLSQYFPYVEQVDMAVLKTQEKDGDLIVVIQANDMLCDMKVIKGKDNWIARGVSCNGQYVPSEKGIQARKQKFIANLEKEAIESNKTCPKQIDDFTKLTSIVMDTKNNEFVITYSYNVTDSEVAAKKEQFDDFMKKAATDILNNDCNTAVIKQSNQYGISKITVITDKNGKILNRIVINKDTCGPIIAGSDGYTVEPNQTPEYIRKGVEESLERSQKKQ